MLQDIFLMVHRTAYRGLQIWGEIKFIAISSFHYLFYYISLIKKNKT